MLSTLAHLFHPQTSNNHRPRILHPAGLIVLVGIFLLSQALLGLFKATGGVGGFVLGFASSITPDEIVNQTNGQRAAAGLPPLTINAQLNQAAIGKANDMFQNQYWAHISPSGTTPWVFIKNAGYNYSVAGENLARDFSDTNGVVGAWMGSPTHRANIVNDRYKEIGVAVVNGTLNGVETTLVVQMFGSQGSAVAAIPKTAASQTNPQSTTSPQIKEVPIAPAPLEPVAANNQAAKPTTPTINPVQIHPTSVLSSTNSNNQSANLISPLILTQSVAAALVILLAGVLGYDAVIAYQHRTVRLVGKNWAHFSLLSIVLIIIFAMTQGVIT